jgi:hypothetical protein
MPSEKTGTLQRQSSGRWAICRPGQPPVEITSDEEFRIEVRGVDGLQLTRMAHLYAEEYYSADGYPLWDGLRAALGSKG